MLTDFIGSTLLVIVEEVFPHYGIIRYIGSTLHVLLNLLNSLRKRDKMRGLNVRQAWHFISFPQLV